MQIASEKGREPEQWQPDTNVHMESMIRNHFWHRTSEVCGK